MAIESDSSKSNQTNKARLRLLQTRESLLEDVFEDARSQLNAIQEDASKYAELLKSLILQVRTQAHICFSRDVS